MHIDEFFNLSNKVNYKLPFFYLRTVTLPSLELMIKILVTFSEHTGKIELIYRLTLPW